ncbi:unnamed protein product, partial [Ectocarpus sp. 8 AP-2014]
AVIGVLLTHVVGGVFVEHPAKQITHKRSSSHSRYIHTRTRCGSGYKAARYQRRQRWWWWLVVVVPKNTACHEIQHACVRTWRKIRKEDGCVSTVNDAKKSVASHMHSLSPSRRFVRA